MATTKKPSGARAKYNAFFKKFSSAGGYISSLRYNASNQQVFDVEFDKEVDAKEAITYAKKQGWGIYANSVNKRSFFAVWFG